MTRKRDFPFVEINVGVGSVDPENTSYVNNDNSL